MLRQRRALLAVGPLGLRIQEEAGGAGDGGRSTRSGQGENAGKRFFPRLLPPLSSVGLLAGGGRGRGGGEVGTDSGWTPFLLRLPGSLGNGTGKQAGYTAPLEGLEGTRAWPLHNLGLGRAGR